MALRGVNVGGWLILERWISPGLFNGLNAQDELSFCLELGGHNAEVLEKHWDTWITEDDFAWIANAGLDAVRIPVGHWVFGDIAPYARSIEYVDWAMAQAEKYGLAVLLDLHGLPGSQNGNDHSGAAGPIRWHRDTANIGRSLAVVDELAKRYAGSPALYGIEVINEPSSVIPKRTLLDYYDESYGFIRLRAGNDKLAVISDAFSPGVWKNEMNGPEYINLALDMHLYQCYSESDKRLDPAGHIKKTESEWAQLIEAVQENKPAIIGEWSLALDNQSYDGLDDAAKAAAKSAYGRAQLNVFENAAAWFYWTYKTEDASDWNFRHCVERGLITL